MGTVVAGDLNCPPDSGDAHLQSFASWVAWLLARAASRSAWLHSQCSWQHLHQTRQACLLECWVLITWASWCSSVCVVKPFLLMAAAGLRKVQCILLLLLSNMWWVLNSSTASRAETMARFNLFVFKGHKEDNSMPTSIKSAPLIAMQHAAKHTYILQWHTCIGHCVGLPDTQYGCLPQVVDASMSVCGIVWHCVGGDPPSRIDYVWVSGKPVGARVTMQRAHKSCSYSDHLGVEAVCKFEETCIGRCVWVSLIERTASCLVLT